MTIANLASEFHEAMRGIYKAARGLKPPYHATYFKRMVDEMGGLAAAQSLLAKREVSAGFNELCLRGKRLDLSVEYLVLQGPWSALFNQHELAIAAKRLTEAGFPLPPAIAGDATIRA